MNLTDRITYWRGQARMAERYGLAKEAKAAGEIVEVLCQAEKTKTKADSGVNNTVNRILTQLYDGTTADR
jgi:hypothetical protein